MKIGMILLAIISFNVFSAPVNVNKADVETLSKSLKNIGIKKAGAIVEYRIGHGFYNSLRDLENVKGIGAKTLAENAQDILFTDPVTQEIKNTNTNKKIK